MKNVASILTKKRVPLEYIMSEPVYYLNRVAQRKVYRDGKPTKDIAGYVYTVTNTQSFDQINVFVEHQKALMEQDELETLQENGEQIFVEFVDASWRPYYSKKTADIEDSIRAKDVSLVNNM